jgi:hypothetical protein
LGDLSAQETPDATFTDADALRGLQFIIERRPSVVFLDQGFAALPRGQALVNRMRADPSLAACEIRVVRRAIEPVAPAPVVAPAPSPPGASLDTDGTRQAPRTTLATHVEALIDGRPVTLVDLSTVGAQVVSVTMLRPGQNVRFTLPVPGQPVRLAATVAWATFEMPGGKPHYRAGLKFQSGDHAAIDRFCAGHQA